LKVSLTSLFSTIASVCSIPSDLFARDAKTPSLVNVTSKAYRKVYLTKPGTYTATLTYNNGSKTVATWTVRNLHRERKAKNIILFIGDGMSANMITVCLLINLAIVALLIPARLPVSLRTRVSTASTRRAWYVLSILTLVCQLTREGHGHIPSYRSPDDALH
jgi:hypothetical protein